MPIGDYLNNKTKDALFKMSLEKGSVFINNFDGIDHPKLFIVVGLSADKIYTCSVYINSNIHPAILAKQSLLDLQVPIKGSKYSFLTHDSFVCCSTPIPIESTTIQKWQDEYKTCNYRGQLDDDDLGNVITTLVNSGLLTDEEIELYFN